jgi:hypothetical protein
VGGAPRIVTDRAPLVRRCGQWHLGGCSPNGSHTPAPSEYGFDHTGTYGSPVYAGCIPATAKDE